MPPSSLSLGRWFGLEIRAHVSLLLLLALSAGFAVVAHGSPSRGVALWLLLLLSIFLRESTCAVTASFFGLHVRGILFTPVGGVLALSPRQATRGAQHMRAMVVAGLVANLVLGLLLVGFSYGIDPHVRLFAQPWISTAFLLRSSVWMQVLLLIVNLVPATLSRQGTVSAPSSTSPAQAIPSPVLPRLPGRRGSVSLVGALALALVLSGIIFGLLWPVLVGLTVLFTSFLTRAVDAGSAEALSVDVRDVMLTEYKPLNASSTLRDALRSTTHSTQDIFPVLRGERLVGWISRTALALRLRVEGDGFLQGAMVRSFHAASPGERIGEALRRATSMGAGEFIPVVEGDAMIGLLTPVSLERAASQLRLTHGAPAERETS